VVRLDFRKYNLTMSIVSSPSTLMSVRADENYYNGNSNNNDYLQFCCLCTRTHQLSLINGFY
jgi:hypothetical protein